MAPRGGASGGLGAPSTGSDSGGGAGVTFTSLPAVGAARVRSRERRSETQNAAEDRDQMRDQWRRRTGAAGHLSSSPRRRWGPRRRRTRRADLRRAPAPAATRTRCRPALDHGLDGPLPAHAVSGRVERRRERPDREAPRHDGDDAAPHAALRGHPDLVEPLARRLVEACRRDDRQDLAAVAGDTTCTPVSGLRPPFARVAPITARSRALTLTERWRVYRSNACSGSPLMTS